MDSNIIAFPEDRIVRDYPNQNIERMDKATIAYTDNIVEFVIDSLIETIENNGLEWKEQTGADIALVSDALTSMVYRMLDKHHPIQDSIKIVDDEEKSEENVMAD